MKCIIVLLYSWAEGKPLSHSENDKGWQRPAIPMRASECPFRDLGSPCGPFGGKGGIDPDYVGLPHFEVHRAIVHTCRHCGVVS